MNRNRIAKCNECVKLLEDNGYSYIGCANQDFSKIFIRALNGSLLCFKDSIDAVNKLINNSNKEQKNYQLSLF